VLVGLDDLLDIVGFPILAFSQAVLTLALLEMFGGVDEEDVVGLLALLENEDADRDAGGVEQIRGQADDGVDVAVLEQLFADLFLGATAEEHAVRQDDGHDALVRQVMEAVQEEGEVGGGLRGQSVIFEPHVAAHIVLRFPTVTERGIGDDGVELGHPGGVGLAQKIPVVGQRIAVVDFKFRVLHPVQQHVHAREIVSSDVLLLAVDLADAARAHLLAYVEQQRAGTAGEVENLAELFDRPLLGFLAVEGDDAREDGRNLLRGVELAGLLARAGGELPDQVFVGVAEGVCFGGELGESPVDFPDDVAEFPVLVGVGLTELVGAEVDLGKKPLESALEGVVFDVAKALPQRIEQVAALVACEVRNVGPEVVRLDDVVDLAPHLFLEIHHVAGVVGIPDCQRHAGIAGGDGGIVPPQFLLRRLLVVVREVAQEEEGQHVVAEIVRVHRPAQLVGDVPEGLAQLSLVGVGHWGDPFLRGCHQRGLHNIRQSELELGGEVAENAPEQVLVVLAHFGRFMDGVFAVAEEV